VPPQATPASACAGRSLDAASLCQVTGRGQTAPSRLCVAATRGLARWLAGELTAVVMHVRGALAAAPPLAVALLPFALDWWLTGSLFSLKELGHLSSYPSDIRSTLAQAKSLGDIPDLAPALITDIGDRLNSSLQFMALKLAAAGLAGTATVQCYRAWAARRGGRSGYLLSAVRSGLALGSGLWLIWQWCLLVMFVATLSPVADVDVVGRLVKSLPGGSHPSTALSLAISQGADKVHTAVLQAWCLIVIAVSAGIALVASSPLTSDVFRRRADWSIKPAAGEVFVVGVVGTLVVVGLASGVVQDYFSDSQLRPNRFWILCLVVFALVGLASSWLEPRLFTRILFGAAVIGSLSSLALSSTFTKEAGLLTPQVRWAAQLSGQQVCVRQLPGTSEYPAGDYLVLESGQRWSWYVRSATTFGSKLRFNESSVKC